MAEEGGGFFDLAVGGLAIRVGQDRGRSLENLPSTA